MGEKDLTQLEHELEDLKKIEKNFEVSFAEVAELTKFVLKAVPTGDPLHDIARRLSEWVFVNEEARKIQALLDAEKNKQNS